MKKIISLILTMLLLVSLVACQQAESATMPQDAQTEASGTSTEVATTDGTETYKEHLTIVMGYATGALDPNIYRTTSSALLQNMAYNTLLNYDSKTMEVGLELATSWEWVDDTYTKLHVKIRDDVTFHNGEHLTTEDVEFSLARSTNTIVANSYSHSEIVDDYEMYIYLSRPDVDFPYILGTSASSIVSKVAVEADPERGYYIGSGPWIYDLDGFVEGDKWELVRNDNYWGELPKTKAITVRLVTNATTRLIGLQNGEYDVIAQLALSELETARADGNITVTEFKDTTLKYIVFNNKSGPASDDLNLRQAISRAINRDELIAAVGRPNTTTSKTYWGPHMQYYFDDFDLDLSYNEEEAKKLLAAAKTDTISMLVDSNNEEHRIAALVIQEQLRKAGINLVIEETDSAGISSNTMPDVANFESVMYSSNFNEWDSDMNRFLAPGSYSNRAMISDKRVEELIDLGLSTNDETARAAYYDELQTIVHDNCYYTALYNTTSTIAWRNGVGGIMISPTNAHDYSYTYMVQ